MRHVRGHRLSARQGVVTATALVAALAVSGCSDDEDPPEDTITGTYAPTSSTLCAELGLEGVTAEAGLGEVFLREPEHSDDEDGTHTVCGADSPPRELPLDSLTPGASPTEGAGPATEAPFVNVVVEVTVRDAAPAPDLDEERERYAADTDSTRDATTTEITGWWSEGIEGHASVVDRGEEAGYATGAAVVDDNVKVEIGVTVSHSAPETYVAGADDLRDRLLDLVESQLERA